MMKTTRWQRQTRRVGWLRHTAGAVCAGLVLGGAAVHAQAPSLAQAPAKDDWASLCDRNGNQAALTACALADLATAQAGLAEELEVLAGHFLQQPARLDALRRAQQGWSAQVDVDLALLFPLAKGEDPRVLYGSSYPMMQAMARALLTKQRTDYLQKHWRPQDAR